MTTWRATWRETTTNQAVFEEERTELWKRVVEQRCDCGGDGEILLLFRHWCSNWQKAMPHLYRFVRSGKPPSYEWEYAGKLPGLHRNILLFVSSYPDAPVYCGSCGGRRGIAGEYDIR